MPRPDVPTLYAHAMSKGAFSDHVVAAAYGAILIDDGAGTKFWGWGGFKDMQAVLARAIVTVIDDALLPKSATDHPGAPDFKLRVVVKSTGFTERLPTATVHMRDRDRTASGATPDEAEVWERLKLFTVMGTVDFSAASETPLRSPERKLLAEAISIAEHHAKEALRQRAFTRRRLWKSGSEPYVGEARGNK